MSKEGDIVAALGMVQRESREAFREEKRLERIQGR